ncbi:MAG: hypothetical protein DHS20C05_06220 [Hyphococcus sp.]|nr:MAG: hypothetical protein DHS20C05_06220 [Marinicaulis sp.]
MNSDPFFGPFLKVERADKHIRELEEIFRSHINSHVKSALSKTDEDGREKAFAALSGLLPPATPTIIGDAIHNLRVSLDHAYWVAVRRNAGQFYRFCGFPFGKKRADIENSINGWPDASKPKQCVIDFILDDVQPFEGGGFSLYDLHRLDITDKHDVLLPSHMSISLKGSDALIHRRRGRGGDISVVGPPDGTATLILGQGQQLMINPFGPIEFTGDLQSAVSILFGEGPLKHRPVLQTLRNLSQSTAGVIEGISRIA